MFGTYIFISCVPYLNKEKQQVFKVALMDESGNVENYFGYSRMVNLTFGQSCFAEFEVRKFGQNVSLRLVNVERKEK